MKINVIAAIFLILAIEMAHAEIGIELSRDLAATAKTNNVGLNYSLDTLRDNDDGTVGLGHRLHYNFSNSVTSINLNSLLNDFEIKSLTHQLGYDLNILEKLTIALKFADTTFNTDEAKQRMISGGLYYQFANFQVGYSTSNTETFSLRDVQLLGVNYKDDIIFNRRSNSYFISLNWTDNFISSLNYTEYTYDKNLDLSYLVLTTVPLLNRAGGAVANEMGSQLKNSIDLNLSIAVSDNWLITVGAGSSQDYLTPSEKSNNATFGFDYETTGDKIRYRFFAVLDVAKKPDVEGTSNSGQLGLGLNF